MCNFENGFILCTCNNPKIKVHNKKSRRHKKNKSVEPVIYYWFLYRFIREFESMEMGRYIMPISDIGAGLTAEWVLLNLNCEECFDFDYTPKEGDNLIIKGATHGLYPYLSFIFKGEEWIEEHYDAFTFELELNMQGQIKAFEDK